MPMIENMNALIHPKEIIIGIGLKIIINEVVHSLPGKYRWMITNASILRHIYNLHRYELRTIWHHI